MRAARRFIKTLTEKHPLSSIASLKIELYGSLALTGKGHGTDIAVLLGLLGYAPDNIDPEKVPLLIADIRSTKVLKLFDQQAIPFVEAECLLFHKDKQLPYHPNGMRFTARNFQGKEIFSAVYYSVGGGFIVDHATAVENKQRGESGAEVPYSFSSAKELLDICQSRGWSISQLMLENEKTWLSEEEIKHNLLHIWKVMQECVNRGCHREGVLPGGLNVKRRAAGLYRTLEERKQQGKAHAAEAMEWVSLWALAVNEENASAGRVVTAPTNGAAGVIPAVIHYYQKMTEHPTEQGIIDFLLTAGAIGILFKIGASISAAEMGCMGEVGVACAMAAGGLTAAVGGTNEQIENAAEIGMEHNLGLTCDPINGLVQIPCIERNTMGAVKAINASLLALRGDGLHRVSLDQVIATMRQTGKDMNSIYKETSLGGLAVNVPEC
jgi:L-serine dehydratase